PTHAPPRPFITESIAVTRPPGLVRQVLTPSSVTRSTGSRLATTTKSCRPGETIRAPRPFPPTGPRPPSASSLVDQRRMRDLREVTAYRGDHDSRSGAARPAGGPPPAGPLHAAAPTRRGRD